MQKNIESLLGRVEHTDGPITAKQGKYTALKEINDGRLNFTLRHYQTDLVCLDKAGEGVRILIDNPSRTDVRAINDFLNYFHVALHFTPSEGLQPDTGFKNVSHYLEWMHSDGILGRGELKEDGRYYAPLELNNRFGHIKTETIIAIEDGHNYPGYTFIGFTEEREVI